MVTQTAEALAAKNMSLWISIPATPATNGARVRTIGRKRANRIAAPPWRS